MLQPIEWEQTKIVPVRHWRGAMAYWGLACYWRDHNSIAHSVADWSMLPWLQERVNEASTASCPEAFARRVTAQLSEKLSEMQLDPLDKGVGIHFTAYEWVDGYWIPELFLISNWRDPSYRDLRPDGLGLSRETFHTVTNEPPDESHREATYRMRVLDYLKDGNLLFFNNGDPLLFSSAANGILAMFRELAHRGWLTNPVDVETLISIARRPVEIVSKGQADFCPERFRRVGGKPHDLAITPAGEYTSTTGDSN